MEKTKCHALLVAFALSIYLVSDGAQACMPDLSLFGEAPEDREATGCQVRHMDMDNEECGKIAPQKDLPLLDNLGIQIDPSTIKQPCESSAHMDAQDGCRVSTPNVKEYTPRGAVSCHPGLSSSLVELTPLLPLSGPAVSKEASCKPSQRMASRLKRALKNKQRCAKSGPVFGHRGQSVSRGIQKGDAIQKEIDSLTKQIQRLANEHGERAKLDTADTPTDGSNATLCDDPTKKSIMTKLNRECASASASPCSSYEPGNIEPISKPGPQNPIGMNSPRETRDRRGGEDEMAGSRPTDWTNLVKAVPSGPSFKISWRRRRPSELSRSDGLSVDGRLGVGLGEYELVINGHPLASSYISLAQLNRLRKSLGNVVYLVKVNANGISEQEGALVDLDHFFIITSKKYFYLHPLVIEFNGDEQSLVLVVNNGTEKYQWPSRLVDPSTTWLRLFDIKEDLILVINQSQNCHALGSSPPLIISKKNLNSGKGSKITFRGCHEIKLADDSISNNITHLKLDLSRLQLHCQYVSDQHQSCDIQLSPKAASFLVKLVRAGKIPIRIVQDEQAKRMSTSSNVQPYLQWHHMERQVAGHVFKLSWRRRAPQEIMQCQSITPEGRQSINDVRGLDDNSGDYEVIMGDNATECTLLSHAQLQWLTSIFMSCPYLPNKVPGKLGALVHFGRHLMIKKDKVEYFHPLLFYFEVVPSNSPYQAELQNDWGISVVDHQDRYLWIPGTGLHAYFELFSTLADFKLVFESPKSAFTSSPRIDFLLSKRSTNHNMIRFSVLYKDTHEEMHISPDATIILEPMSGSLFIENKAIAPASSSYLSPGLVQIQSSKEAMHALTFLRKAKLAHFHYVHEVSAELQNAIRLKLLRSGQKHTHSRPFIYPLGRTDDLLTTTSTPTLNTIGQSVKDAIHKGFEYVDKGARKLRQTAKKFARRFFKN